ncbi:MAG: right-handed parallel beta-helix repeat-containing protein [Planctomycetota bacterium]|nr:right-handed parallel beta-helix repeat-containing protein [Planctomycetota bacterium]
MRLIERLFDFWRVLRGIVHVRRAALRTLFEPLESRVLLSSAPTLDFTVADIAAQIDVLPVWAGEYPAGEAPLLIPQGAALPLSSLPALSSRPAATAKLYLDFDGDTVSNWAYDSKTGQAFHPNTIPAYDVDGNPSTFSDAERGNIQSIWARVSEFYSPFDVDVTTVDPAGVAGVHEFKIDLGGTGTWLTNTAGPAGGVALIGAFDNSSEDVGFVFTSLSPSALHYIAVSTAHEAGHGFGLVHQRQQASGQPVTEYYSGDSSRAPIMGNASNNNTARALWWLTQKTSPQFSPDVVQNELAILSSTTPTPNAWNWTTNNGFGYRADDHGNTAASADAMTATLHGAAVSASGVIEQAGDVDYFSFTTTPGIVRFQVSPAALDGMLDAKLELRDAAGALLASADTATPGETINYTIANASSYRVDVASHGSYGDIGQYTLTGQLPDRFENNDTRATAADLGVAPGIHIADADIDTPGDEDWYSFTVLRPGQGDLDVKLTSTSLSSLTLLVTDASGQAIGTATNSISLKKVSLAGLAAGTYHVRVAGGVSGATTSYVLAIDPAATNPTRVIYLNDASTTGDVYSSAAGDDANDGLTPQTPKRTLQSVLATYTLGAHDLVLLDAGSYAGGAVVGAGDQGAAYAGAPAESKITTDFGADGIELDDADGNLFHGLSFTSAGGVSIDIHGSAGGESTENTIQQSQFLGLGATAIRIDGGDGDVIQGNFIRGAGNLGLDLVNGQTVAILGNKFGGLSTSIRGEGAAGSPYALDIEGNSFTGDGATGITLVGDMGGSLVRMNTFTGYIDTAIDLGASPRVAVEGNTIYGSPTGIRAGDASDTILGNTISGNGVGIAGVATIGGPAGDPTDANDVYGNTIGIDAGAGAVVQSNRIYANTTGLRLLDAGAVSVVGNAIHDNGTGIHASSGDPATATVVGDPDTAALLGNDIYDNSTAGIDASGNVSVVGNRVHTRVSSQAVGISVADGASASHNEVFGNTDGIHADGASIVGNRVFHNSGAGIVAFGNSSVTGNQVYSNAVGIRGQSDAHAALFTGTVGNNLVYANAQTGLLFAGAQGARAVNNTVYQSVGDALRVGANAGVGSSAVFVENNILWVDAGHDIFVEPGSQAGFASDYNLFRLTPGPDAQLASWGGLLLAGLSQWRTTAGMDTHGQAHNPAVPNPDGGDADFVDIDGADNVLGYQASGDGIDGGPDDNFYLNRFSPAIDAADPAAAPLLDKEGRPRALDPSSVNPAGPADVGAYEFAGRKSDDAAPHVLGPPTVERVGSIVRMHVAFSEAVNPIDVHAFANYRLIFAGADGLVGGAHAADDVAYAPTAIAYDAAAHVASLDFNQGLPLGAYELSVSGMTSVHDLSGNKLDGNGDGQGGDDFTFDLALAPPRVTKVLVKGSGWSSGFLGFLAAQGLGDSDGYVIPVGSGAQLAPLPWTNLNQITLRFSGAVAVQSSDLVLRGVNTPAYSVVGFATGTGPNGSFEATWTLSAPITVDKLLLSLSDNVADAGGNKLDGEWTNPASLVAPPASSSAFPSGDGLPGGAFTFRINVAPGDANQNGGVNVQDAVLVRNKQGTSVAAPGSFTIFDDVNGNGGVNVQDVVLTRNLQGKALPAGEPALPAAAMGLRAAGAVAVLAPSGPPKSSQLIGPVAGDAHEASAADGWITARWRLVSMEAGRGTEDGQAWLDLLAQRRRAGKAAPVRVAVELTAVRH